MADCIQIVEQVYRVDRLSIFWLMAVVIVTRQHGWLNLLNPVS